MKGLPVWLGSVLLVLIVLAALAPSLIALSGALIPLVVVLAIAFVGVRLVLFHTRRW